METELTAGTLVNDRYRIQLILGQGGFGRTYLASDHQRFGERCVLKEFTVSDPGDVLVAQELFAREAKTLYQLDHPQIPKFLAFFEDNGRLFLAQEFVRGKTYAELLIRRLRQDKVFSETEIIQWLQDLLPVLEFIHQKRTIHRDISTDNVMLAEDSLKPILIDFGAVKYEMSKLQTRLSHHSNHSDKVTIIGKQGYSPPEQLRTGECFPNSDLYALAVTALVLMTGKNPKHLFNNYSLAWQWRSYVTVNEHFAQILDKMLEEKPQNRYQSASEVLYVLQGLQANSSSTKRIVPNSPYTLPSEKLQRHVPWKKLVYGCMGVLSIVFISAIVTPNVEVLCQFLQNCSVEISNKKYQERYNKYTKEANAALVVFQNATTLENLRSANELLKNATTKLAIIPENTSIYQEVQRNLPDYQNQLQDINNRLKIEERAAQLLSEAEAIARNTNEENDATNIEELNQVKAQLKKAIDKLDKITEGSLVEEKKQARQKKYQAKIKIIDDKTRKLEQQRLPRCEVVLFGSCRP